MNDTQTSVFLNDKGGTGKSTCAALAISRHLRQRDALPIIVEVESEARLGRVYGAENVTTLTPNASPDAIAADPALAFSVWDRLGSICMEADRPVVADLGANLAGAFTAWVHHYGEDNPWGMGTGFNAFAVTSGDEPAIQCAHRALVHLRHALPEAALWLLVNGKDEPRFKLAVDAPAVKRILKDAKGNGALYVPPYPPSAAGLAYATDNAVPLHDAALLDTSDWKAKAKLDHFAAVRAKIGMRDFVRVGMEAFNPVWGALPA